MSEHIICPYCNKPAEFISSKDFYGTDYDTNLYICRPCNARVGTHGRGKTPLGTLANHRLRTLRKCCHKRFDTLWKSRQMKRGQAYQWMAQAMNLPPKEAHIGMFDEEQCKRLLQLLRPKLRHKAR